MLMISNTIFIYRNKFVLINSIANSNLKPAGYKKEYYFDHEINR